MSQQAELYDLDHTEIIRERFAKCRYVAVRGLLAPGLVKMLYHHIQARAAAGNLSPGATAGSERALETSSDMLLDNVLQSLTPQLETITGLALYPTYSFVRIYRTGDVLRKHVDRHACEVSVSIHLGRQSKETWPLWVEGPCGMSAAALEPGDAVLYRGSECSHWREEFPGATFTQVFLHYVEQEGPNKHLRYDGREALPVKSEASGRSTI